MNDHQHMTKGLYSLPVTAGIFLTILIVRIIYLQLQPYEIFFEEAQYWTWSKALDWGYYSKPPMIAWLIASTTTLCGDESTCLRLSAPILHMISALFVYLIGKHLYDPRVGFWSGLTYLTLPGVTASSYFISTDVPLMFFWTIALYCFVRAYTQNTAKWWLLCGIVCGLGMLSKYTMLAFLPSALLLFFLDKNNRQFLKSPYVWLAILTALIIFSPNLLWNSANNFVSFSHTQDNVISHTVSLYPTDFLEFFAGQFIIFGPLMFAILLWLTFRIRREINEDRTKLLFLFTLPLVAIGFTVSLLAGAQAHWVAPAYIAGTILVSSYLFENKKQSWLYFSIILHLLIAGLFYHYPSISNDIQVGRDAQERVRSWNDIADQAKEITLKHPNHMLLSDERKTVAMLMYALRDKDGEPHNVLKWNQDRIIHDHYDLTTDMNQFKGSDFIFVTRSDTIESIQIYFLNQALIDSKTTGAGTFYFHQLSQFQGYE